MRHLCTRYVAVNQLTTTREAVIQYHVPVRYYMRAANHLTQP